MGDTFGARLRSFRTAAGMSMGELAGRINYSKSYLSKIENDLKPPNATVARLCDSVLGTGGALSRLIQRLPTAEHAEERVANGVWVMSLDRGDIHFHEIDRRQVLAGAGAMLGFAVSRGTRAAADELVVDGLRMLFDQYRQLGRLTTPVAVLGPVIAQVNTIRTLAVDSPEPIRAELMLLASRVAEYAGWMSQEAGDGRGALWWTRYAVELAEEGHDRFMVGYALVRRAEMALYRQDAMTTVDLAQRAQAEYRAGPRILGQAARCEAQGHALAGDLDACQRALDHAAELLAIPDESSVVFGSSSVLGAQLSPQYNTADQVSLARGWALLDLGRPAEAAVVLDRQVDRIAPGARRARARFGTRQALAHAHNKELEQACVVISAVLDDVTTVDSATIRMDLRQLTKILARWRSHAAVREVYPRLTAALYVPEVAS